MAAGFGPRGQVTGDSAVKMFRSVCSYGDRCVQQEKLWLGRIEEGCASLWRARISDEKD